MGWEGKGCSFGEDAGKARGDGGIVRLCECVGLGRRKDAQEVIGPGASALEQQKESDLRVGHGRDGVEQTVM